MKIVCIGRNYLAHAKELKNEVPTEPVVFIKADSAVLQSKNPFFIPSFSNDIHHEVELVLKINRLGKHIQAKFAHKYFDEIGLGIDFTARDVQKECKDKGLPWEKAKSFDGSCVVGKFFPKGNFKDFKNINFSLLNNEVEVQKGNSAEMMFDFGKLIEHVSKYFTLKIGDLIFTGTPSGVSRVESGDVLEGILEGESAFKVRVK